MLTPSNEIPTETVAKRICDHCGNDFEPRKGNGGKPQRFCKPECKAAFHIERLRSQRSPTYNDLNVGDVAQLETELATPQRADTEGAEHSAPVQDRTPVDQSTPSPQVEDFDWTHDGSVVLREQYATAIYFNKADELVIRQHRWPDEDQFIFVGPECQQAFIDKLTDAMGIPAFGK